MPEAREWYWNAAWSALGAPIPACPAIAVPHRLASPYAVDAAAVASVEVALCAAADLAEARGLRRPVVSLNLEHVIHAFASERHISPAAPSLFGPLSRFAPTRDGHIRLHANYPHHEAALMRALDHPSSVDAALKAIATHDAVELEDAIVQAGGVTAAVRSREEWRQHPQARAIHRLPLLDLDASRAIAAPLPPASGSLPCAGLRVLDLTRVIAGPVAGRMLAALGAEVLRIEPPAIPELPIHVLDGMVGKRSAVLDLATPRGRGIIDVLLSRADVLLHAYRPASLDVFGLDVPTLSLHHSHLVSVSLSAWGHLGPWAHRRGFDSLVQAATGISSACGSAGSPGALPVQALDHASGYLMAATALWGLLRRQTTRRAAHGRLALTRTAAWLTACPTPLTPVIDLPAALPHLVHVAGPEGQVQCLAPIGTLDGSPLTWPSGVPTPGADVAAWLT